MIIREAVRRSTEGGWGGAVFLMLGIEAILCALFLVEVVAFSWFGSPDAPPDRVLNASVVDVDVSADGARGVSVMRVQYGAYGDALRYIAVCHPMRSAEDATVISLEHGHPLQVDYSPVDALAAIGCDDGSVYLLRADDELPAPRLLLRNPQGRMDQLAFSPDGRVLVSLDDLSLNVWSVTSGELNACLPNAPQTACCFTFVPDSQSILLGSISGVIYSWTLAEPAPATKFAIADGPIRYLACSSTSRRVVAVGIDGALQAWDLDTKQLLWRENQSTPYFPSSVAFSADGKTIISAVANAFEEKEQSVALTVRDAETGETRGKLMGHTHRVTTLATTSDTLLYSGSRDGTIRTWDLRSRAEIGQCSFAGVIKGCAIE